jgi:hypothetical protein
MQPLSLIEQQALEQVLKDPICKAALTKFFSNQDEAYTVKSRQALNVIPDDLHSRAKHEALARQYAAMAKAYGTALAELEKAVKL